MNISLLDFHDQFRPQPSYAPWRDVLRGAGFVPGDAPRDRDLWHQVSGGRTPLTQPPAELYLAIGRGAAKTETAAMLATWKAVTHTRTRWFGQRPFVLFTAGQDQRQADECLAYSRQLLDHPTLRSLVSGDPAKRSITLKNSVRSEVLPSEGAKIRGRGALVVVVDEAGFYPPEDSADLLAAIRPALGRVPGSLLIAVSTKDRMKGFFYDAWKAYYGVNDPNVLVIDADTLTMNPTFNHGVIERAFREDPVAALSEYGRDGHCAWRSDVTSLITAQAIAAVTSHGVIERPPLSGVRYRAFVDLAGGSGSDSAVVAVAHSVTRNGVAIEVLDAVLEIVPPFSPADVCAEFAQMLRRYEVRSAIADRWGSQFAAEAMSQHGIHLDQTAPSKSDLYLAALPLINSRLVDLLDDPKLARQATALERRAGGTVDHPPRSHDDRVNACVGALICGRASSTPQYRVSTLPALPMVTDLMSTPVDPALADCPIPIEIRGNADAVMQWLIAHEPPIAAATDPMAALAGLWHPLAVAGIVPRWGQTVSRIAAVRLRMTGAHDVAA